jgi:cell division protein DivIC
MIPDFKKKQHITRTIAFKLGAVLVVAICIFLAVTDYHIYQKKKELTLQVENLQTKIQEINNSNSQLQEGIDNTNDSQYIEKVAREELDLQKPGEKVVSFIMPQNQEQTAVPEQSKNALQSWQAWVGNDWQWLKSKW